MTIQYEPVQYEPVQYEPQPNAVVDAGRDYLVTIKAIVDSHILPPATNVELAGALGGLSSIVDLYETLYHDYWRSQYEQCNR